MKDIDRVQLGYELIKMPNKATEDHPEADYFHLLEQAFQALDNDTIDQNSHPAVVPGPAAPPSRPYAQSNHRHQSIKKLNRRNKLTTSTSKHVASQRILKAASRLRPNQNTAFNL